MPGNTVYVGRGSKWGNPFKIGIKISEVPPEHALGELHSKYIAGGDTINRELSIQLFMSYQYYSQEPAAIWMRENIALLRGKHLACWCPLTCSCHADYLLKIANV
jgi:hypothetical protein